MTKEEIYFCLLGSLFASIQGLEFAIRAFLHDNIDPENMRMKMGDDLNLLQVGDKRRINSMTCSNSLKPLISKYNKKVTNDCQVDLGIIDIRDALAHGRVFDKDAAGWFHLLKFGRKKDAQDMVVVEFSQELNEEWLREQNRRVVAATRMVISQYKKNGDTNV